MRINSDESIRRARAALEKYGSYENIAKEGRIRANMCAAKTKVRLISRPEVGEGFAGIQFSVEFLDEEDQKCFYVLRLGGIGVNGENLDNRGHMISEETLRKKGMFRKPLYRYDVYMRNNSITEAFALDALAAWDKHKADIKAGEVEILLCLPTPAEGDDTRGFSKGSVSVQPRAKDTR